MELAITLFFMKISAAFMFLMAVLLVLLIPVVMVVGFYLGDRVRWLTR